MKAKAKVISVSGTVAIVECVRMSACEGCHRASEGSECSICSLMGGNRTVRAKAENLSGAKVGDDVIVESSTSRILGYAAAVFLLPLLLAALFYGIASAVSASDLWKWIFAGIGFAVSFFGTFFYSRRIQKDRCDVIITEILDLPESIR